jgi:hypothetical protein
LEIVLLGRPGGLPLSLHCAPPTFRHFENPKANGGWYEGEIGLPAAE